MFEKIKDQAFGLLAGVLITFTVVWVKQCQDAGSPQAPRVPAAIPEVPGGAVVAPEGARGGDPGSGLRAALAVQDPFARRVALYGFIANLPEDGLESAFARTADLEDARWRHRARLAVLRRIASRSEARALALARDQEDDGALLAALIADLLERDWQGTLDLLAIADLPQALLRRVLREAEPYRSEAELARARARLGVGVPDPATGKP